MICGQIPQVNRRFDSFPDSRPCGNSSSPKVSFEEIAIDLLEARFWITAEKEWHMVAARRSTE
jgi:hypothetical protein